MVNNNERNTPESLDELQTALGAQLLQNTGPLIYIKIKINKSLYLSVNVFSTAVLIEDTVNIETNSINQTETC